MDTDHPEVNKEDLLSRQTVKPTVLSTRLSDIVSMIDSCNRVLDIGSDHGHTVSYLLENNRARLGVATDIHQGPAENTRRYLRRQGVYDRALVLHGDGLKGIVLEEGDVVILSGLGGLEIIHILEEALIEHQGRFKESIRFVLQPQRSLRELRTYLNSRGFTFENERISFDRNKFYVILLVGQSPLEQEALSLPELVLGPCLLRDRPAYFVDYMIHQKNVLKKQMKAKPELKSVIMDIDSILLNT